jgi:predicted metalloprotease with PDZ domain
MKKINLCFAFLFFCVLAHSQKMRYLVGWPNAAHHEANIQLVARDIPGGPAIFRMSRSSPGRYATHEFGKNIYNVKAFDKNGSPIPIEKIDGDIYRVPQQKGFVTVSYTIYANYADGTYAGIDEKSIHLNMPAVFMWMKGMDNAPIEIFFDVPGDSAWEIATQLKPTSHKYTFTAPSLQYFMDCPTKIGNLRFNEWKMVNPDNLPYQFRLALEANTTDSIAGAFADKVHAIVTEAQAVYGELPKYDYDMYTFIASINPYVYGDGMEHRNSTMITIPAPFNGGNEILEVFAHEFFHCWNVERIRPKSIEPFNFEKSNMSGELWFAEGFTQYYGELLTKRAGYYTLEEYLSSISSYINTKNVSPGGKNHSPIENSQMAVFVDAGVAIDKTNYPTRYASYYPLGAAVALALDLELRTKFKRTLDDYMHAVWKQFGKIEIPYTVPGLQQVLEKVTNKSFANEFFSKYVFGHEPYNYAGSLAAAGIGLKNADEGKAWWGNARYVGNTLVLSSNTIPGTPLYEARIDIGDEILAVDQKSVKSSKDVNDILQSHKPGDKVEIKFRHRAEEYTRTAMLSQNPAWMAYDLQRNGRTLTDEEKTFRKSWLESRVK